MYNIAIVDDEKAVCDLLSSYFEKYKTENGGDFVISAFPDGLALLDGFYLNKFDIIFLDIEMPFDTGMAIAHKIRKVDENVTIIFVTNMAQYAIEGYSVRAYSFVLKPVSYLDFSTLISRTLPQLNEARMSESISITSAGQLLRLAVRDITYVEINGHRAVYHIASKEISSWESMKAITKKLENGSFALCNACYLVNLRYVKSISDFSCFLTDGTELIISQAKKKSFMQRMTSYLGRQ